MNPLGVVGAIYDRAVDLAFEIYTDLFGIAEEVYAENKSWCTMLREAYSSGADAGTAYIEEEKWRQKKAS